jgi:hypothetical protein
MNYLTVKEAGKNGALRGVWLHTTAKPDGLKARKKGNLWLIPIDAKKPLDGRRKKESREG